jgi:hypothetical protein
VLDKFQKYDIIIIERTKEDRKMKALNKMEEKVLEMIENGVDLHGWAREVAVEMALREMAENEKEG